MQCDRQQTNIIIVWNRKIASYNMYRLPPLKALRAFEAAARRSSFKDAAEELHVTPGAVGQQIARLEDDVGIALFERLTRAVHLTSEGKIYLEAVRHALRTISEATRQIEASPDLQTLTVSVLPSFAIKWLVPRLGKFYACEPKIDVRISTTSRLVNFAQEDVDVAIRHGMGDYPGLCSWQILPEDMMPVCSPTLLENGRSLARPEDLDSFTLLHDQLRRDWKTWLAALGISGINISRGPSFSDDALIIQAAVEGHGVALARTTLAERDLTEGRLIVPFNANLPSAFSYYLVCPEQTQNLPRVKAFRDWLTAEVSGGGLAMT